jgi:hypothetical protein
MMVMVTSTVMTTVLVSRPEKESSLAFIQVLVDQRNTNIRKKVQFLFFWRLLPPPVCP